MTAINRTNFTEHSSSTVTTAASAISNESNAINLTKNNNVIGQAPDSGQSVSTLARQLAASAARADERDNTLSRSELADKAKILLSQISGDRYFSNKARHDSEVPKTDDPELLARAKQATDYVNDSAHGGNSIRNPFASLSREQLSNIIYDDSGTYTVNERRAAYYESSNQEQVWRAKVVHLAQAESNSTGKLTNFFGAVLDHYNELPAIEQAQYPTNYAMDLQDKINLNFNYRTHKTEGDGNNPDSSIDIVLKQILDPNINLLKNK